MPIKELSTTTFEVDISVQNNTLSVGANGGNVRAAPGDTVVWQAAAGVEQFTLQFFRLASEPTTNSHCEPVEVAELPRWPFSEPPAPPHGLVGPTRFFRGTLARDSTPATAFKYTVTVGNLVLDPVVILDR